VPTLTVVYRPFADKLALLAFVTEHPNPFPSSQENSMVYNPSLREQPRQQPAPIIPMERHAPILDWLEESGRLLARQPSDPEYKDDEAEINALMGSDDNSFDDDDDDADLDLED
jgi:Protein of unknown function (DUF3134)